MSGTPRRGRLTAIALAVAWLGGGTLSPAADGPAPITDGASVLPTRGKIARLRPDGEPTRFRGAELYGHVDGGAEPFLELGFDHLVVQEYEGGREAVTVELYVMDDPTGALGIYLMNCGREQRLEGVDARHSGSGRQVLLVGGNVFAVINDAIGDGRAGAAVARAARAVGAALPPAAAPPELERLPTERRVAGSERIIRGPFTLQAVYTFGEGDVLQLGGEITAVAANYDDGNGDTFTRIVTAYPGEERAAAAFAHLIAALDPGIERVGEGGGVLLFSDWAGRWGVVTLAGSTIDVVVNLAQEPVSAESDESGRVE